MTVRSGGESFPATTSRRETTRTVVPAAAVAKQGADDGPAAALDDKGGSAGATAVVTKARTQRVAGHCTGRSTAKLKVKADDGRLGTEFEVDQNRNGVRWTVRLSRNGHVAVRTSAITRAPSGSFSVERRLADGSGADRISARATSPSGEVCTASLTY